jgi:hypothetical protein
MSMIGLFMIASAVVGTMLESRPSFSVVVMGPSAGTSRTSGTEWVLPFVGFASLVYVPGLLAAVVAWICGLMHLCGFRVHRRALLPVLIATAIGLASLAIPQAMEWIWREFSKSAQFPSFREESPPVVPWHAALVNPATARLVAFFGQSALAMLSVWICVSALRLRVRLAVLAHQALTLEPGSRRVAASTSAS